MPDLFFWGWFSRKRKVLLSIAQIIAQKHVEEVERALLSLKDNCKSQDVLKFAEKGLYYIPRDLRVSVAEKFTAKIKGILEASQDRHFLLTEDMVYNALKEATLPDINLDINAIKEVVHPLILANPKDVSEEEKLNQIRPGLSELEPLYDSPDTKRRVERSIIGAPPKVRDYALEALKSKLISRIGPEGKITTPILIESIKALEPEDHVREILKYIEYR